MESGRENRQDFKNLRDIKEDVTDDAFVATAKSHYRHAGAHPGKAGEGNSRGVG